MVTQRLGRLADTTLTNQDTAQLKSGHRRSKTDSAGSFDLIDLDKKEAA
jgi:hypothetical protein